MPLKYNCSKAENPKIADDDRKTDMFQGCNRHDIRGVNQLKWQRMGVVFQSISTTNTDSQTRYKRLHCERRSKLVAVSHVASVDSNVD
jgi:hypothetical protein